MKESEVKDLASWISDAVAEVQDEWCTLCWHHLDEKLMMAVGWSHGWGEELRDDVIQDPEAPDWGICAGIFMSNDDESDLEYLTMPYFKNGEVWDTNVGVSPEDVDDGCMELTAWLVKQYNEMRKYKIDASGCIKKK